jgi:hypothetical protein
MGLRNFSEWQEEKVLLEMSARRSFAHTLAKFRDRIDVHRPVAVLTAFRGDLSDDKGKPLTGEPLLARNRKANKALERELAVRGFSYYPVMGVGQEESKSTGLVGVTREESFIIQPILRMNDETFLTHVKELLFNAKNREHQQWGAAVKLPTDPIAFLLHHSGEPQSIADYNQRTPLGASARVRRNEPYYTQMVKGPKRDFVIGGEQDEQPGNATQT